jgi:hypothetical protein
MRLFQVSANNVDEVSSAFGLIWILFTRGVHDMMPDMIFQQFSREATNGTANRGHKHENVCAANLGFQRSLHRLKLALNPPDPA